MVPKFPVELWLGTVIAVGVDSYLQLGLARRLIMKWRGHEHVSRAGTARSASLKLLRCIVLEIEVVGEYAWVISLLMLESMRGDGVDIGRGRGREKEEKQREEKTSCKLNGSQWQQRGKEAADWQMGRRTTAQKAIPVQMAADFLVLAVIASLRDSCRSCIRWTQGCWDHPS